MKKGNATIIVLAVIVILLAAGTYFYLNGGVKSLSPSYVAPSAQPVVSSGGSGDDAQLNSDLNSVNTNLNSLDTQSSQADTGLNQTAVDPTQ